MVSAAFTDVDGEIPIHNHADDTTELQERHSFDEDVPATFTGTPPEDSSGSSFDIKVTASDGTASVSDTFKLTIESVTAPIVINSLGLADFIQGVTLTRCWFV